MATKKKKPAAAEFNTIDIKAETTAAETLSESEKMQAKAGTIDLSISEEIKQKLDSIDKLADENARYAAEVSQLQSRIAEYISEIEQLNKRIAELSNAEDKTKKPESEPPRVMQMAPKNPPLSIRQPRLTPNCYRRRIIGEYPSWN